MASFVRIDCLLVFKNKMGALYLLRLNYPRGRLGTCACYLPYH
jgi:hypothetical protein